MGWVYLITCLAGIVAVTYFFCAEAGRSRLALAAALAQFALPAALPQAREVAERVYPPPCSITVAMVEFEWSALARLQESCHIELNALRPWHHPGYRQALCWAVVHEYGHARGLGHSENMRDPMYPRYVGFVSPGCLAIGEAP